MHVCNEARQQQGMDGGIDQQGVQEDVHHPRNGVAFATILLACFIAEHNLPLTKVDHLVLLMKHMFPDSAIAQGMSMKRTKCTEVVKLLGRCVLEELVEKLRKYRFSVTVDESTDVSTVKSLAVIVR